MTGGAAELKSKAASALGTAPADAAGQQAREFMRSEPVAGVKAKAEQVYTDLSANPKVRKAAGEFKKETLSVVKETTGLTPRDAKIAKERVEGAVYRGRGVESASASFETAAPKRCRQPVKDPVVQ